MDKVLFILGIGMMAMGIAALFAATGAINIIIAPILFGFGAVTFGLAGIIARLDEK